MGRSKGIHIQGPEFKIRKRRSSKRNRSGSYYKVGIGGSNFSQESTYYDGYRSRFGCKAYREM